METTSMAKAICSVVGFLGLLSAVLAFAAEANRLKASQVEFTLPYTCVYPSSPALGYGIAAAVVLMVAQIIINVATGCICCTRGSCQSNSNWKLAVICYVFSWITFLVASLELLSGVAVEERGKEDMYFGHSDCYVVKPGLFALAAVLSLASVVLGILHYLVLDSVKPSNGECSGTVTAAPNQGDIADIAMAQPHFPPPHIEDPPAFVHEDTYARRQFTSYFR